MAKNQERADEQLHSVEEALSKSEQFIEENQKPILIVVAIIIAVVLGYFSMQKFYFEPREQEAQESIFMAQKYFEKDSLNLALNGDGNNLGFLDIIDNLGGTKAGNLASYYAGISYLKKGEFETALKYLKKFSSDDIMIAPMATSAIGDCHLEMGKVAKAADTYYAAAKQADNKFLTPQFLLKAGNTYELAGDKAKAHSIYLELKKDFANSSEGRDIDRYIGKTE
ncbi:MAG: tetratricopeptide repeat protein [Bacteroidales bacterium]|nr:tetratricopeptide repeat protein [Bacteroidales bacterium]